ncbi:phytochelatin synthase, catalyse the biosynthesis of PCs from GSH [Ectocarpus siliculosus]|uniref:glutathione gamma-glutamylcysteinyltransferase n=1 Tax=Ectocarpus siliculosus TaxID=2880 RepID=D7G0A3_ECTSI|nr:phytochelatin synthase, catalyse the biosynthesis of PCs from GSH [Ectocarpus siliculosus]|eukprot:CBJ32985.1 phytochelatin synthase, catalyse the biosynthesis of PCs from GSH [Ectocarpus siliculosus]
MENYFRLAEQFRTQEEVTFCGLSTLTMVLNALAVDPGRVWKGPWRWYHESMLDCCAPLETVKDQGITLSTMACLARCNGLAVDVARTDTHTLEDLRAVIEECSSADAGRVVVVSYDRRGLKQTGSGHFSPIGGYHKEKDLVLIMDTARFKLPPHWAPLPILWEAMQRVDPDTGRPRGYMVLEKAHSLSHRLFYANARNYKDWPKVASWVNEMIELACGEPKEENDDLSGLAGGDDDNASKCPAAAAAAADVHESRRALRHATTVAEFVPALMTLLPPEVKGLLTTFDAPEHASTSLEVEDLLSTTTPAPPFNATEYASGKAQDVLVLQAIQGTDIYREVTNVERNPRSSDKLKLQQDENQAAAAAAASSSPCCAPTLPLPAAAPLPPSPPAVLSPASGALSSAYSFCPKKSGCGCSWRHEVSIVAYALLLLLHKRDDHGEVCGGGGGGVSGAGAGGDIRPPPLWRKDPLHQLPATVAIQAKHVAGMLVGLVELEECEKCKAR